MQTIPRRRTKAMKKRINWEKLDERAGRLAGPFKPAALAFIIVQIVAEAKAGSLAISEYVFFGAATTAILYDLWLAESKDATLARKALGHMADIGALFTAIFLIELDTVWKKTAVLIAFLAIALAGKKPRNADSAPSADPLNAKPTL